MERKRAVVQFLMGGFILAALVLTGGYCASTTADKVSGGEELEGWRLLKNGEDAFYMKISGSASPAAKESGEEVRMKSTCVESTKLQANDTIIRKMVGEEIQSVSGTADAETTGYVVTSVRQGVIKGVEMKECAAVKSNWSQCECVHFVSGRNLRKKFKLQVEKLLQAAQSGGN